MFRPIWIKFGTGDFHAMQFIFPLFVKTGAMKSILHLGGEWKFSCHFYTFRPIWIKFGTGDFHAMQFNFPLFVKTGAMKSILHLGGEW